MSLTYTFLVVRLGDDDSETAVSPKWINFDADSSSATFRTFTFTPTSSSHAGKYKVRVRGRDFGRLWDEADFELEVKEVNDVPEAPPSGLADPDDVEEDTDSAYVFAAFEDEEDDAEKQSIKYEAKLVVGGSEQDLPSSRAPTRRPNLRKEPQSRSLQRTQQNRKSAEMHQAGSRRGGRRAGSRG